MKLKTAHCLSTHLCLASTVTGCTAQVPNHLPMCPAHWRLVPQPLQQQIYNAFRHVTRRDASLPAIKTYTDKCEEAVNGIAALRSRNPQLTRK